MFFDKYRTAFYLLLFSLMCWCTIVDAQSRHALVNGNSEYGSRFNLINPRNDSIAIAEKLQALGYEVHRGKASENLQLEQLNQLPIVESKLIGPHCIIECSTNSLVSSVQEFGALTVQTAPADAVVCYQKTELSEKIGSKNIRLPLDQYVTLTVSAEGYEAVRRTARISAPNQQIAIQLREIANNTRSTSRTLKIVGGVAALALPDILLSNTSGDDDSRTGTPGDTHTFTFVPPEQ